jgi:hypothetical protein
MKGAKPKPFEDKYVPEPNSGCWIWIGADDGGRYGNAWVNGKLVKAHRASYEMHRGPIPAGMQIDHLCRVKCCVNPDHLEAVTDAENRQRAKSWNPNRLKRECPEGHPYSGDNLHIRPNGNRRCKHCSRVSALSRYHRNRGV